jgi:all-trans-retinol 13,14-reductase
MPYDFLVIGAGISGITSAIALARNGLKVALLEKGNRIAPLLRGFSRQGVQFDTGFHYTGGLGDGGALATFFRYLGLSDAVTSFPFEQDGFDIFSCRPEGFEFRFPVGFDAIRDALGEAFPAERAGIGSYLERIRSVCDSMPYQNLMAPFEQEPMLRMVHGPSLRETLDELFRDPLLKSLLSMHTLLYGVPSHEIPFASHAVVVGNYYHSVHGLRGGGLALADACEARLSELGVDLLLNCDVTAIRSAPTGEFCGVTLAGGESIDGKGCICTVHPRQLLDLVPEGAFRSTYRRRLEGLDETVSAFLAFATATEPLPSLARVNRFLLPDPESIHEIGKRPLGKSPLYLSGAYRGASALPEGFIGIFPENFEQSSRWRDSRPGRRPAEYREFKKEAAQRMRNQIAELAPEIAGSIATFEVSTPLTIHDRCGSPSGGLYGVKQKVGQYNPLPGTRMKGLYLAGQALVTPGVLGGVLSGVVACGAILGHQQMREDLKRCC